MRRRLSGGLGSSAFLQGYINHGLPNRPRLPRVRVGIKPMTGVDGHRICSIFHRVAWFPYRLKEGEGTGLWVEQFSIIAAYFYHCFQCFGSAFIRCHAAFSITIGSADNSTQVGTRKAEGRPTNATHVSLPRVSSTTPVRPSNPASVSVTVSPLE